MSRSCVTMPVASNSCVSPCDCLAYRFGNAADHPDRTPCYGSDMTETEWQVVRAALPVPAWLRGGAADPRAIAAA